MNADRPLFDTALTTGDHLLAEPGCRVWAKTEGVDARMRFDGEARGGILLETTSVPEVVDVETGEMRWMRCYRLYDPSTRTPAHQRISTLTERQVGSFEPVNISQVRGTVRRLCGEVAKQKGPMGSAELELLDVIRRLAAVAR